MFKPINSFRGLLIPIAAIMLLAANLDMDCQRTRCSPAFRVTLVDGQNLLRLKVVSECVIPGTVPHGWDFIESLRIHLGSHQVRSVDHLLRWAGSAAIVGLMVVGLMRDPSDRSE